MGKVIWKPFIKYNAIIALGLLAINIIYFFELEALVWGYMFYVYFPIILVAAPIGFGIYYGYYLSNNFKISLKNIIKMGCIIFIISCATYAIPAYEWLLGSDLFAEYALLFVFSPAALHTLIFFCSITINQRINKHRNMQSNIDNSIRNYEKIYRRIAAVYYLSICVLLVLFIIIAEKNNVLLTVVCLTITYRTLRVLRVFGYRKAIYYKIQDKFYKDLDIKCVLNYYQNFTQNKKRFDYKDVLFSYLNYLTIALEFDQFRKVYLENRSYIQKKFEENKLEVFLKTFLSISNDQHRQKEIMFNYMYSSYHTKKGKLSRLGSYFRDSDILQELSQHYILKEYEFIIEKVIELEKDDFRDNYVELLLQSMKERSLYHLGKECQLPEDKQGQVLSGYKWWYLIEMGQDYCLEEAEEFISMIDYDLECCRSKKWKTM